MLNGCAEGQHAEAEYASCFAEVALLALVSEDRALCRAGHAPGEHEQIQELCIWRKLHAYTIGAAMFCALFCAL